MINWASDLEYSFDIVPDTQQELNKQQFLKLYLANYLSYKIQHFNPRSHLFSLFPVS